MNELFYKNPAKFLRFIGRCFTPRYRVSFKKEMPVPAVYIIHHQNLRGPITSMLWFDFPVHLWTFSPFCSQKTCYKQYVDYTFTKRFGLPKGLAAIVTYPISFMVSSILQSAKVIPVYRHSTSIIETFRESVSVLMQNEDILICPDIDYKDKSSEIKSIYSGFLNIDKYFREKTGNHIAFVPLHINRVQKIINVGNAIYFKDGSNFKQERSIVMSQLMHEFARLEQLDKKQKILEESF